MMFLIVGGYNVPKLSRTNDSSSNSCRASITDCFGETLVDAFDILPSDSDFPKKVILVNLISCIQIMKL